MARVGFIGLGIMGTPMAANLVAAGHTVVGFSRRTASIEKAAERGVLSASSIKDVVEGSDFVITMLPDSPDVEKVLLGEDGVLAFATKEQVIIDMSTIRPDVARAIAQKASERGVAVLDAPVSGGEAGAIEGVLSIMVGGTAEAFNKANEVFAAMGKTIVHVGPAGSGQTVKAANQLMVATNLQGLAEAVVFLEAHGVSVAPALEVLGGGLAGSTVLARKSKNMMTREFTPGFRMDLFHKDMGIVTSAAREAGVSLLVGSLVAQVIAAVVAQGGATLDQSSMITIVDKLSRPQD